MWDVCILGLDAKCIFYCREWLKEVWSTKRASVPHTFLFHTCFSLFILGKALFVPHLRGALASHFMETVIVMARASTWLRPLQAGLLPPTCKELSSSPPRSMLPTLHCSRTLSHRHPSSLSCLVDFMFSTDSFIALQTGDHYNKNIPAFLP